MTSSLAPQLLFSDGRQWRELPVWCRFLMSLGERIASAHVGGSRLAAAVVVPTRAFAAPLVALGIVAQRSKVLTEAGELEAHLERLRHCPSGTPVKIKRPTIEEYGLLLGVNHENGREYIVVQRGQRDRNWLPAEQALNVAILDDGQRPSGNPFRTRTPSTGSAFLARAIPHVDSTRYVNEARLDCLVVGRMSVLRAEVTANVFAVEGRGGRIRGSLQELLRIRSFGIRGEGYRTQVIAQSSGRALDHLKRLQPTTVIYDGSIAFLRAGNIIGGGDWVAVIDRTDTQFADAVHEINERYIQRVDLDTRITRRLPVPPAGVELQVFQERC